jgi:hypothetical protein
MMRSLFGCHAATRLKPALEATMNAIIDEQSLHQGLQSIEFKLFLSRRIASGRDIIRPQQTRFCILEVILPSGNRGDRKHSRITESPATLFSQRREFPSLDITSQIYEYHAIDHSCLSGES